MEKFDLNNIFQGISTLLQSDPAIMYARIGLILLGILLVYLGRRGVLEPLVMIPMGLGMAAVNAGVLIFPGGTPGNLFLDPMVTDTDALMNILQIDFLQPVYTFTFSNGLIACLIFMGIGTMLDINFLLAKPLQSMFLALCAELGTFAVVMCVILCLLFPVAAPLFFSLFIGIVIKESGLRHVNDFISGPMLYGSTFFLGILLGILCDAHTLLDPAVLKLLVLGILALLISGIGGILGGYAVYFFKRGNFNPVIGIAAVSCVPTTAKVAQKIVSHDNPSSFVLADALGANVTGVITSAVIAAIYVTVIPML